MIYQRTKLLIGTENLEKLNKSHVAIFGLGGVGGYVAEALARSGIGELTIIDFDTVDITNINRQLIATAETIGKYKVDVMLNRIKSINSEIKVNIFKEKFLPDNKEKFFVNSYDYVVDAIDIVTSKIALIEFAYNNNLKIISSMGMGNKLDPTKIEVTDIYKTSVCPLARVMRKELKEKRIKKLKVVYSKEEPKKPKNLTASREKSNNVGSVVFVPSVAGLVIASVVVRDLIELNN